jgi:hypothetical protein
MRKLHGKEAYNKIMSKLNQQSREAFNTDLVKETYSIEQ